MQPIRRSFKPLNLKKMRIDKQAMKIQDEVAKAALQGTLGSLPKEHLRLKNLAFKDSFGMNALHTAASVKMLHKVPKEFLTPNLLLDKDNNSQSVLHYAATFDQMSFLPKEVITKTTLSEKDAEGNSVYHYLANYGNLHSIPRRLITQDVVLLENDFNKDVLDMCLHAEARELNPDLDQSSILLNALDTSCLESQLRKSSKDKERTRVCKLQLVKNHTIKKVKTMDAAIEI